MRTRSRAWASTSSRTRGGGRRGRRAVARRAHRGGRRGCSACSTRAGIDTIFLLSPTTTPERIRDAARLGRGFLYAISRLGRYRRARPGRRWRRARWSPASGSRRRCRWRWASASRIPITCARWGGGPTPPWSAAALVQVIAECGDSPSLVPRVEELRPLADGRGPGVTIDQLRQTDRRARRAAGASCSTSARACALRIGEIKQTLGLADLPAGPRVAGAGPRAEHGVAIKGPLERRTR